MPMKRRKGKRRAVLPAEAWDTLFACGTDYFGELEATGLVEPFAVPPAEREAAQAAWDAALGEAWTKHGAAFLRAWEPQPGRATPWALEAFGPPENMEI